MSGHIENFSGRDDVDPPMRIDDGEIVSSGVANGSAKMSVTRSNGAASAGMLPLQAEDRAPAVWSERLKRAFDIVGALAALVLLAPLMIVVAVIVYLDDPGPVFFAHPRIGRSGREFCCYKFRSMSMNADKILRRILENDAEMRSQWNSVRKLKSDPRVTRIGRFLRKSSIDELPQLLNILKGEMSFVGPRPITYSECEMYGRYIKYYLAVVPGVTGLWQVSGRNQVSYRRRVALDVYYVRHRSLMLDLAILFRTFSVVVCGHGQL